MSITYQKITEYCREGNPLPDKRVEKSDAEWQEILPVEIYQITREHATEAPGTSDLCTYFKEGVYACACCQTPLFSSKGKFASSSGWPSFTEPAKENVLSYHEDHLLRVLRIEVRCSTCDAHLGHVFPDGPEPTGLRYCINGLALIRESGSGIIKA